MPPELKNLQVNRLHPSSFHRRTIWGDMPGLIASITTHGVIEPLVVRERKAGGYEIICGERRRRAAEKAELKTVPCIVHDVDDATAIAMQVDENLKRADLHPMDEAGYFEELTKLGFDPGDIAKRFALKRKDVVRRLKLVALSPSARTAFVKGKIDEESALSLARLENVAKQNDVIAAIEAGHLQPEEVPFYVQRTFTATLDDIPWSMTDGEITPAGPCSACPKRTGVQRELFGDVKGEHCLDVDCYRVKMDAVFSHEQERDGLTMFTEDGHNLFIPTAGKRPVVMKASGMVDAEATCPYMLGHSWREAVREAADPANQPTEYLTRDQDGRPRYMFREAIVTKLVRGSDAVAAQKEAAEAADPEKPTGAGNNRAEAKIRRALIDQLAEKVSDEDHDTWGWNAARVIEGAAARALAMTASQFEDQIKEVEPNPETPKIGLLALVSKSNRWAKRVVTAIQVREEADVVGEIPESLRELAKICGVDLRAIERAIRKEAE